MWCCVRVFTSLFLTSHWSLCASSYFKCQQDVTVAVTEISCLFSQATAQILMSVKALKPVFTELVLIPKERSSASVHLITSLYQLEMHVLVCMHHLLLSELRRKFFFIIKPTRCTNFTNLFWHETLHVSDSSSVHPQEFIYCTLSNGICHTGLQTAFEQDLVLLKSWLQT
jgi:UDP-N-acetylglucosamine 2-epimerase